MGVSILVLILISRVLYKAARAHSSQALEADALHFSTDIWSSSVVIVGLVLVWLSERLGPQWAWLAKGDAVAALVVALIVIYVSLQLGHRAISMLLDTAPPGLVDLITAEAGKVAGVQSVGPVRVRQSGAEAFADLTLAVDRSTSLEEAHQIAAAVEEQIGALLPRGDVVVHVDPVQPVGESLTQATSAIAARLGLRVHNIHAHEVRGNFFVDLHAEVPPDLTLGEAHERISRLEAEVRNELPYVRDIHTHIEPRAVPAAVTEASVEEAVQLRTQIMGIVEGVTGLGDCHEVHIRPDAHGYDIVVHCLADPDLPIGEAHRLADVAEKRIHAAIPGLSQVLLHIEPRGQA
jgi:divalent metal cation (Fe/Co/Zn/Cd) transporter